MVTISSCYGERIYTPRGHVAVTRYYHRDGTQSGQLLTARALRLMVKLRLTRHPYAIDVQLFMRTGTYFELRRVSLDAEFGISSATLAFLTNRAECAHCNHPVNDLEDHMACGTVTIRGKKKTLPAKLLLPRNSIRTLQDIAFKERTQRWSVQRKLRIESAAGSHTREEIMILRQLQEDRCFYCFASLLGPGGGMNGPAEPVTCHKDHFSPLRKEGTNFISNIVLACPSCNSSKCEQDGMAYLRECMAKASREDRVGLKRIHKARKKHPFHLVPTAEYLVAGLDFSGM